MKTYPDGGYKGEEDDMLKGEKDEGYMGDSQGYSGDHSGYRGDIGIYSI